MAEAYSQSCPVCRRTFTGNELYCPYDRTPLSTGATVDPLLGKEIAGAFTILERLGGGGMGVVYRAHQHRLNRAVALKILPPHLWADAVAQERFRREARAASQLANPHTVSVYDFGTAEDGTPYIAMQLLQGESLRERLRRGALSLPNALSIAAQVCEALAEAHESQPRILHRDIKPENIFVRDTPEGSVFATLLDLGLASFAGDASLTSSGVVVGTPTYLAPEQYTRGHAAGVPADLYAVGVLLYEMLAGTPPFAAANPVAIMYMHIHDDPAPLPAVIDGTVIPPAVQTLVLELLAKDPAARPSTAAAIRLRLLDLMVDLPRGDALPPTDRPTLDSPRGAGPARSLTPVAAGAALRPSGWLRRERLIVVAGALLLGLILAGLGRWHPARAFVSASTHPPPAAPTPATVTEALAPASSPHPSDAPVLSPHPSDAPVPSSSRTLAAAVPVPTPPHHASQVPQTRPHHPAGPTPPSEQELHELDLQ